MSYEGYEQILCQNGHYNIADAFDLMDNSDYINWKCSECGAKMAWTHSVDTTNDEGDPAPLTVKTPAEICTCSCGHKHNKTEETYHIPKGYGRLVNPNPEPIDEDDEIRQIFGTNSLPVLREMMKIFNRGQDNHSF